MEKTCETTAAAKKETLHVNTHIDIDKYDYQA